MIDGYPASASVAPGGKLVLHVATDAARFRVRIYRWEGDGLLPVHVTAWLTGKYAEPRGAGDDWQWPAYELAVAGDWPSAVYIAHLVEAGCAPPSVGMASAAVLFVVRGSGHGGLLYKIPLCTYHAYNSSGGGCFYANQPRSLSPPGARLSFQRPGGGIGGPTWGALDYYDSDSARQTFAHWDAPFIAWLLRNGYTPEFCTDLDIHADPALCKRYRLLLSVGHDEYWSEPTRDAVEAFIGSGGNAAFFSANLCWWRVHIVDDGKAMVCHQGGPRGALDHWWPASGANRPEDALAGVSYRHGGGWWDGARDNGGYVVQQAGHWVFNGTGLRDGDAFGGDTWPPLVGYECDGAPLDHIDPHNGRVRLSAHSERCGTPAGFHVLAASLLDSRWQERPPRESLASSDGVHAATMGIYTRKGTVFTAGTTDWAQVLGGQRCPALATITRNVMDRLLRRHALPSSIQDHERKASHAE